MSKLEDLIEKFCSNGVEYKKLSAIATDIYRGSGIKRDEITAEGIPCVRYGEIYTTYKLEFNRCVSHTRLGTVPSPKYFENGDILFAITGESVADIAKSIVYTGAGKCLAGGDIVVMKHNQDPKYISYALDSTNARKQKSAGKVKSKVVHSSVPAIKEIVIPVPPLPVQREIVRILDSFTELTAELSAELSARKKQYEYYSTCLLSFNDEVQSMKLGDIAIIKTGTKPQEILTENGLYEYWNAGTVNSGLTNEYNCDEETVITPSRGQGGIGYVGYISSRSQIGPLCYQINSQNKAILKPRFLYHYLKRYNSKILALKKEGGVPAVNASDLKMMEMEVPTISDQERIVSILDRFDTLCNDLSSGLPAEIEARRKQYEYYRDKLLTFKELA